MNKWLQIILFVLAGLLLVITAGPFLVPVPPLEDTVPPRELADPDSRFVEVNGLEVHYKQLGQGEPELLLLHGFAASVFSWREIMEPLSEGGTVIAFDRPAFGLTERPLQWAGQSPYSPEAQADLTVGMMDALGIDQGVLVGNSAGGAIAVLTAARYPERVQALVLVDAAIYTPTGAPELLRPVLRTSQADRLGPLLMRSIQNWGIDFARSAWHNPDLITPEIWSGYNRPLQTINWDKALWELTVAGGSENLPELVRQIEQPALVITGDDDRIVPPDQSIRLADEMPEAELAIIPECGHIPHEECPEEFLRIVNAFLSEFE